MNSNIILFDEDNNPKKLSEITLGNIFEEDIIIINSIIFRKTDTLEFLSDYPNRVCTLFNTLGFEYYNNMSIRVLKEEFNENLRYLINEGEDSVVIILEDAESTKFPRIYANGHIDKHEFWRMIKNLNELRESSEYLKSLSE